MLPGVREARVELAAGRLRGDALAQAILAIDPEDRDDWVDEVLGFDPPPPDGALPRGGVPYLPCGVTDILDMVRLVPLRATDQFVDVGSGLGRVAILAHLLSGARAHGVEVQRHLCARARELSEQLGLGDVVTFQHANAAEIDLDGSVFFFYAPCNGELLRQVMARIEPVAQRRPIAVVAASLSFATVPWLRARPDDMTHSLLLYDGGTSR